MKNVPVIDQIIDLAQSLIQTRGYNAMSYRALADQIGIKTQSELFLDRAEKKPALRTAPVILFR